MQNITSNERKYITRVQGRVNFLACKDNLIAVAGNQENLVIIKENTEEQLHEGNRASILTVSISPDCQNIVTFAQDGWAYLYTNNKLAKKTQVSGKVKEGCLEQYIREFSPDSKNFALPGDLLFRYLQAPD